MSGTNVESMATKRYRRGKYVVATEKSLFSTSDFIVGAVGSLWPDAQTPDSACSTRRYPHFREQGYDCGSGPTESQCGTLTHRVKGAGMRWDADNVESMMVLAALDHSQQWQAYWKLQRAA